MSEFQWVNSNASLRKTHGKRVATVPNPREPALFDVRGGAKYLGRTQSTLRHWIERGHIPALKIGGRVFLRRATLDRFLADRELEWMQARGGPV